MKLRYFPDTDTLLLTFSDRAVAETNDLTNNIVVDMDGEGNPVAITIEHANSITNVSEFIIQQSQRLVG
jgi:uncharacterized protein YuzE